MRETIEAEISIKKEKTAIYARKSTLKIGQKDTIENQIKICRRSANEMSLEIVDIKTDSATGTDDNNRPEVKTLIRDAVKGNYSCVIMKGISRLYRKTSKGLELIERLDQNGIRFVSVEEHFDSFAQENRTGTGKLDLSRLTMYLMFAEMESSKLADRIKYTQIEKAHAGEWNHAGSIPFGYDYVANTKKLAVNYSNAETIKLIFNLYLDGLGMKTIAFYLNGENEDGVVYPSPKGKSWSQYTIGFMLKNRVYVGDIVYNKRSKNARPYKNPESIGKSEDDIYIGNDYNDEEKWIITEDAHEAIIEREVFNRAQQIIETKGIRTGIRNNISLLAGLAKCGKCETGMTFKAGSIGKDGKPRSKSKYYCSAYIKYGKRYCTSHHMLSDVFEEFIISDLQREFQERLDFEESTSNLKGKQDNTSSIHIDIKRVEKDIQMLSRKMDTLLEKNIDGVINDTQFKMQNDRYSTQLDLLTHQLEKLRISHKKVGTNQSNTDYLKQKYELVVNMESFPVERKRYLLHELIDKITLNEGKIEIEYSF